MSYVDGMMAAVPLKNKESYQSDASAMGKIFREYGATQVVENWGVEVPDGKVTSMRKAVQCKEDEEVVFSWIIWPSKEKRDEAWQKMEEDKKFEGHEPSFDGKRLIYGGFSPIVEL